MCGRGDENSERKDINHQMEEEIDLFGDGNATIITEVIILKWEIMKSRENLSN
jgi:hypothetical protein